MAPRNELDGAQSAEVVAQLLGITPRRLQQLAKDGHIEKASRGRYRLVPAVQGYIRYLRDRRQSEPVGDADYNAERTRLTKEQADERAMKNAVLRAELAPVAALTQALTKVGEQINSIFDSIPLKVKNRLPHLKASEVEIIARELVKAQNAAATVQLDISDLD